MGAEDIEQRLRRFEAGELSPEILAWLREGMSRYRRGASGGMTLDEAFGLSVGRGGKPWYVREAMKQRDEALRQLVTLFGPGGAVLAQATWLQSRIRHYQTTAWRFDCNADVMPERHRGTGNEFLFLAFKAAVPPSGIRQLTTIIQNGDDG